MAFVNTSPPDPRQNLCNLDGPTDVTTYQECRRHSQTQRTCRREILLDLDSPASSDAFRELLDTDATRSRLFHEAGFVETLIREERVVQLPELSLLSSAFSRLRRHHCLRMNFLQRHVLEDHTQLSGS